MKNENESKKQKSTASIDSHGKQKGNEHINKCMHVQLWLRKLKLIKLIWGCKCNWNGKLAQCNELGAQGTGHTVHFSCINNYNACTIPHWMVDMECLTTDNQPGTRKANNKPRDASENEVEYENIVHCWSSCIVHILSFSHWNVFWWCQCRFVV